MEGFVFLVTIWWYAEYLSILKFIVLFQRSYATIYQQSLERIFWETTAATSY